MGAGVMARRGVSSVVDRFMMRRNKKEKTKSVERVFQDNFCSVFQGT